MLKYVFASHSFLSFACIRFKNKIAAPKVARNTTFPAKSVVFA